MHLGKFHAAISLLAQDYGRRNVIAHLQGIVQQLDSIASNPGNADVATNFKNQFDSMRLDFANSSLNNPYPTLAALLDSIGAMPFIGNILFQRVEDLIAKNGVTPQLAATALRELLVEVNKFYEAVIAIERNFEFLDVEYIALAPGEGEIGISIPKPAGQRLLSDLADITKKWNKALRPFVEIADPENNPIAVRTISSSDWQFYLTAAPAVYLALSAAISQMNELLHKLIETRQLIAKLTEKGVSANATAAVIAEADTMLENGTRALAEKVVSEHETGDAGRENELKNELTASLKFLARELAANVTLEIRYQPPSMPAENNPEGKNADAERIGELRETAAQIARNMDMLRLDSTAKELLNLPAPEDEKD